MGQNNNISINTIASYATGAVTGGAGTDQVGALQGSVANSNSRITASYATGNADGGTDTDTAGRIVAIVPPVLLLPVTASAWLRMLQRTPLVHPLWPVCPLCPSVPHT